MFGESDKQLENEGDISIDVLVATNANVVSGVSRLLDSVLLGRIQ